MTKPNAQRPYHKKKENNKQPKMIQMQTQVSTKNIYIRFLFLCCISADFCSYLDLK